MGIVIRVRRLNLYREWLRAKEAALVFAPSLEKRIRAEGGELGRNLG